MICKTNDVTTTHIIKTSLDKTEALITGAGPASQELATRGRPQDCLMTMPTPSMPCSTAIMTAMASKPSMK
jgi:hypothetical protein